MKNELIANYAGKQMLDKLSVKEIKKRLILDYEILEAMETLIKMHDEMPEGIRILMDLQGSKSLETINEELTIFREKFKSVMLFVEDYLSTRSNEDAKV